MLRQEQWRCGLEAEHRALHMRGIYMWRQQASIKFLSLRIVFLTLQKLLSLQEK